MRAVKVFQANLSEVRKKRGQRVADEKNCRILSPPTRNRRVGNAL
jgi:hypothetical protein